MKEILILDCTLRDGGYVNDNNFGYENISKIIKALNNSKVDIIECGYIKDDMKNYSQDITEYTSFDSFQEEQKDSLKSTKKYQALVKLMKIALAENDPNIETLFKKFDIDKCYHQGDLIQYKRYDKDYFS